MKTNRSRSKNQKQRFEILTSEVVYHCDDVNGTNIRQAVEIDATNTSPLSAGTKRQKR